MTNDDKLDQLARSIHELNRVSSVIANLIGRPAEKGHVGEYIAAAIFDLELESSATSPGIDGRFTSGLLRGRSVNVKWYAKLEGFLDIREEYLPDFYLVLAGPRSAAESSRGTTRDWLIESVYLFEAAALLPDLRAAGVKIGTATSVRAHFWEQAEVYPSCASSSYRIDDRQRAQLRLFGKTASSSTHDLE